MRYADRPTVEAEVHIAAPPAQVWPLVRDIELVADTSEELQEATWLPAPEGPGEGDAPAVGHRFRGRNAHPQAGEWETVSTVVECDEARRFTWAVMDTDNPSALWRFTLTPVEGGTELHQWAQMGPGPSNLNKVIEKMPDKEERIVAGRLREWQASIERTLAGIKARAES
ncbi:polyketide cyclase/dehydrase/lipid transport protein [Actinomycetospora succinea]|uniref:Polyketide cyclase/dehydrase/lipid transport protein n=1 Tax=Actinomycetospora succinea TaxID=663603 RepID=A0A4R6UK20_9PSEU|nr:SRPBCC family protein [Actinomycetospora succinea]TDQ47310.1 polyketide cyclase/dehydrase/lipid transport protein [Actinomycetospora succinea]